MRQGLILIASLVQRSELSFEAGAMDHVQSRATNASPQSMFHQEFKIKNNSQSQEKQETQGKKGAHTTKQYKKPKEAKGKKKATESKWRAIVAVTIPTYRNPAKFAPQRRHRAVRARNFSTQESHVKRKFSMRYRLAYYAGAQSLHIVTF